MDSVLKLVGATDYSGCFQEVCDSKHAEDFMNLVHLAKQVQWRKNTHKMTENEVILCEMLEQMTENEKCLKGNMLMYVRSGVVFRQLLKTLVSLYKSYDDDYDHNSGAS